MKREKKLQELSCASPPLFVSLRYRLFGSGIGERGEAAARGGGGGGVDESEKESERASESE